MDLTSPFNYNGSIANCTINQSIFIASEIYGFTNSFTVENDEFICIVGNIMISSNGTIAASSVFPYYKDSTTIQKSTQSVNNPLFVLLKLSSVYVSDKSKMLMPITKLTCKQTNDACNIQIMTIPFSYAFNISDKTIAQKALISTSPEGSANLQNYQNSSTSFSTVALFAHSKMRKFDYSNDKNTEFVYYDQSTESGAITNPSGTISTRKSLFVKSTPTKSENMDSKLRISYEISTESTQASDDWLFPTILGTLSYEGGLFTLQNYDQNEKFDNSVGYTNAPIVIPDYCFETPDNSTNTTNQDKPTVKPDKLADKDKKAIIIAGASVGSIVFVVIVASLAFLIINKIKKSKNDDTDMPDEHLNATDDEVL
ncbi:hypothetical protein TVAG_303870 [Trichomonas vaginalis G3]|uniref:Uncharacterized protein n=1 Tax=Trichomonas vaginalis (strain ATCC PRA-98 / G3) TaxID=412133 RepID=A2DR68_TRIV3|nr:glycoprotein 38 family [Trichomonas vaginalis G3]EAY17167.1 hypothetical protein TVAG_303870 [Trichomonas vaginalis G3]KAI5508897.1 glycoprotein 38 family [Trichomonas vaginalis G3]|eukprot:XP_001329390.1 hypothetical protein [Trichomonas vaginalis G3]